jgi:hypothetical protein
MSFKEIRMSSQDFENLTRLVGPEVNKKCKLQKCYRFDGTLDDNTEVRCNWRYISQHDVPVRSSSTINTVNTITTVR